MRFPLSVLLLALVLPLALAPAPSSAAVAHLVPTQKQVAQALPALHGGTRDTHDYPSYTLLGDDCATNTVVGTAVRGERANYIGPRPHGGGAAPAVAVIAVQKYATKRAADQVVRAVAQFTRRCRGPHLSGTLRNRTKVIHFKNGKEPVGQRAVAYHVLTQQLAADGTVTDHLDSVWYVARSGRTLVMAASGRRNKKATVDQAVALAELGLHAKR